MARFINAEYPTEHAGIGRVSRGMQRIAFTVGSFDGARGIATLLLAALVSALLVVANELVDTWTEGHLLAAWVMMWLIGFTALALFAAPARRLASTFRAGFAARRAAARQAREDRKLWEIAMTDARVMADLSRAMSADAARDLRGFY